MVSADCASFLSLVRTFSLPGMTVYSVSKSLSMSTPRLLLGRSFTCPSEASTLKPFPRYFWIVFAFAGDSTMTKPFANGSLNRWVLCSKLARICRMQQVWHSADHTPNTSGERCQHPHTSEGLHKIFPGKLLNFSGEL